MNELIKLNDNNWSEDQKSLRGGLCRLEQSHVSPGGYTDCFLPPSNYKGLPSHDCAMTSPPHNYVMTSLNCSYQAYTDRPFPSQEPPSCQHLYGPHEQITPELCDISGYTNEGIGVNQSNNNYVQNNSLDGGALNSSRYLKMAGPSRALFLQPVSDVFESCSSTSQEQYLAMVKDSDLDESMLGGIFFDGGVPYQCSTPQSYSDSSTSVKSEMFSLDYYKVCQSCYYIYCWDTCT